MTITIDLTALREEVRAVAAEQPATRNPANRMFDDDGKPLCIMGQALFRVGVRRGHFQYRYGDTLGYVHQLWTDGSLPTKVELTNNTDSVRYWLKTCQRSADAGTPWGLAVDATDRILVTA